MDASRTEQIMKNITVEINKAKCPKCGRDITDVLPEPKSMGASYECDCGTDLHIMATAVIRYTTKLESKRNVP